MFHSVENISLNWTNLFSSILPNGSCRYTTLSYRAPEMVNLYNNKIITTKADIWVSETSRRPSCWKYSSNWICCDSVCSGVYSTVLYVCLCDGFHACFALPGSGMFAVQVVLLHAAVWWKPGGHLWRQFHHTRQLPLLLWSALPYAWVLTAFFFKKNLFRW